MPVPKEIEAFIDQKVAEGDAAVVVGKTVKNAISKTKVFRQTLSVVGSLSQQFLFTIAILLVLFIIHQIFVWIDREPEIAFDRAALLFEIAEVSFDTTGIVWNAGVDVINAGVIPLWNSLAFYVVEPTIVLILEVFSLVFAQQHWSGVFDEADFPYFGLECTSSAQAAQWCGKTRRPKHRGFATAHGIALARIGRYQYYEAKLTSAENADAFAAESQVLSRRLYEVEGSREYTFGIATARRLSKLSGRNLYVAPSYGTDVLTDSLDDFMMLFITLGSTISDVFAGVLTTVLRTSFSAIADAFFIVLKTLMQGLKMIINSGLLPALLNMGVEFIIIFFTEICLPLLFAALDLLSCVMDLFKPSGWGAQLECVANRCFKGSHPGADIFTFVSIPIVIHRFTAVMQATVNSRTGKRFMGFAETGKFKTEDRTRDPNTQTPIEAKETETASQPNPTKQFTFADEFADFLPTTGADKCGGCFVCKVPEMRLVWWIVATIGSIFSEHNLATFAGNTTKHCMQNGSWYETACGPRGALGAEGMTYYSWRKKGYVAGFHERDTRIFSSYASEAVKRTKQMGDDPLKPGLMAAAEAWEQYWKASTEGEVEADDAVEEEKAALFTYQMCRVMRLSDVGEYSDNGPDFHDHPESSLSHLSARYLYET